MEFEVAISFFIGGKNMRHIGEKIILVLCIVVFGIAAMNLVEIEKEYYDGQKEYEELKEYTEEKANGQQDDPTESEAEEKTIDFAELRKINEDIVAWIQIPGIDVDYPVVQGEDNEYSGTYNAFSKSHQFSVLPLSCFILRKSLFSLLHSAYSKKSKNFW